MVRIVLTAALLLAPTLVRADDVPGRDWVPMQRVIQSLGRVGYGPIVKVEAEDGSWQVRAYRRATLYDIKVAPRTGAIREAKPMSAPACGCPRRIAPRIADKAIIRPAHERRTATAPRRPRHR